MVRYLTLFRVVQFLLIAVDRSAFALLCFLISSSGVCFFFLIFACFIFFILKDCYSIPNISRLYHTVYFCFFIPRSDRGSVCIKAYTS